MYVADSRTFGDLKSWNPLINQVFYERNPKDPKEMRTYTMKWNALAGKITPMISNYHAAEPTPEMKPFHPRVMQAVNTMQHQRTEF